MHAAARSCVRCFSPALPEHKPLYRIVLGHLETYLALARARGTRMARRAAAVARAHALAGAPIG